MFGATLALLGALQAGVTYYVSPAGNDKNDGKAPTRAWRTLGKVNNATFAAGSTIALEGGKTFPGFLFLGGTDKGTAASPITITSYGTGRATIDAGTGEAILIYNTAGVIVRRVVAKGSGPSSNTSSGIRAYADLAGDVKLDRIEFDSVEASGFGKYGIMVGAWNGKTGFRNVLIRGAVAHNNVASGIHVFARTVGAHENVKVIGSKAFNNQGVSGTSHNIGSGIVISGLTLGLIERSVAYDNGRLNTFSAGPVGIWAYDADRVTIQYNESYNNRTSGTHDGGGFDLDQNVTNSVIQYNYSHGNDGPGLLLCHNPATDAHYNNVVRYNVSENDNRRNPAASIVTWGRVRNAHIYNNTIYSKNATTTVTRGIFIHSGTTNVPQNIRVRNNIFYADGTAGLVAVNALAAPAVKFEGNLYYHPTAAKWNWKGVNYSTLDAWRNATGNEKLGTGQLVGRVANPGLEAPGTGGTIGNADSVPVKLTAYRLQAASVARELGLDLTALGLQVGTMDFYRAPIPVGAYDVGAHEGR